MTERRIFVRFTAEGFHNWPQAHDGRSYLRAEHRHLFHVEVSTSVNHDEREIEFHDLRDDAQAAFAALGEGAGRMGSLSCEAMAQKVGAALLEKHGPGRDFIVTVSEDGEFGAVVRV